MVTRVLQGGAATTQHLLALGSSPLQTAEALPCIAAQVLEHARQAKLLGSSLEAKVALWAEDAELRENLRRWDGQMNSADPLAVIFIVSEVPQFLHIVPAASKIADQLTRKTSTRHCYGTCQSSWRRFCLLEACSATGCMVSGTGNLWML